MWEWVSHGNWIYSISTWWEFYHQDTFLMLNFLKTSGRFSLYTHSPRDSTSSIRTFNRRKHDFFHYKSGIVDKSYQYCISGIQPALFVFCLAYNKPCENKVEMLYILTYVYICFYIPSALFREWTCTSCSFLLKVFWALKEKSPSSSECCTQKRLCRKVLYGRKRIFYIFEEI